MTNPRILLSSNTIDSEDFYALREWLKDEPHLSQGALVKNFEEAFASKMGVEYAIFVNSGSSALLLIFYSLICSGRLKNDKIVVPAVSWVTDVSPVIQFGLKPLLVDCNMENLAVDLCALENIFEKEKPAAFVLVSVLGMLPAMDKIKALCEKHDVLLIEDDCESMGSTRLNKVAGSWGLLSAYSCYLSHAMSTIEGGVITTNDRELRNLILMIRNHGWGRSLEREDAQLLKAKWNVSDFEQLYKFYEPGFNLRSTDLQAFLGLRQLAKLDDFVAKRNLVYHRYNESITNSFWKAPSYESDLVSCLGYPVIHPQREAIVNELVKNQVECRPLIAGSMGRQPFYVKRFGEQALANADIVDRYGLYVPCHPFLSAIDIEYVAGIINLFS